ncbi:hypothetical protein RCBAKA_57 [Rhodobacter phage RcBaka]|nr:hypothetical protein RCBAKA_57 [Rhodobacter phage RcBaka]QXN71913.1 hypothetical protein RCOCEANUS_44 [Rhodobacter phage RcOceanus]
MFHSPVAARIDADHAARDAALQIVDRPVQPSAEVLSACEAVMARPRDWIDYERARLLRLAVLKEGAPQ